MTRDEGTTSEPAPESFKLPDIPRFFNDRRRDEVQVEEWLMLARTSILMRRMSVSSKDAMRFAALSLRGAAATWYMQNEESIKPQNFTGFAEALENWVRPVSVQQVSRDQLKRIVQRSSVEQYIDVFRKKALQAKNMTALEKTEVFIDNLKPHIAKQVRLNRIGKPQDDLEGAMALAVVIESEMRKVRPVDQFRNGPMAPVSAKSAKFHKSGTGSGHGAGSGSGSAPRARVCYKCGSPDHLRAQCPQLKRTGPKAKAENA